MRRCRHCCSPRATSGRRAHRSATSAPPPRHPTPATSPVENAFHALVELVTPERFPNLYPLLVGGGYVAEPGTGSFDDDDDFEFGLERILDGIQYHVAEVESGAVASHREPPAPEIALPRDKHVREAAKARRDAEKALRDARKRERDAIKQALEREKHAREKEQREQAERERRERERLERAR